MHHDPKRATKDANVENDVPSQGIRAKHYPQSLSKHTTKRASSDVREDTSSVFPARRLLGNVVNLDLRTILSDELANPLGIKYTNPTRRVVSAPEPGRPLTTTVFPQHRAFTSTTDTKPPLASTVDSLSLFVNGGAVHSLKEQTVAKGRSSSVKIRHPLLSLPIQREPTEQENRQQVTGATRTISLVFAASPLRSVPSCGDLSSDRVYQTAHNSHGNLEPQKPSHLPCSRPTAISATRVCSKRPDPFTTAFLGPETHKVVQGQLVVLPSRSLLVDFREGERRKGKKGVEVLLIAQDGKDIRVFSAPHLSVPCCLAEPIATYSLEDLPSCYWEAYLDAGRVINQLKQRIPKVCI